MTNKNPKIEYSPELAAQVAANLSLLRRQRPLVYAITNFVTMNDVANSLLALGAAPVMAQAPQELPDIVQASQALLVNLGTLTAERFQLIEMALNLAADYARPVVLDPVGAGGAQFRTQAARQVVQHKAIRLVRSNLSEAAALANLQSGVQTRGVDSVSLTEPAAVENQKILQAAQVAQRLSEIYSTRNLSVAISGERDWLAAADRLVAVDNGVALLQQISGAGCMLGGICAAFCAVVPPFEAALSGLTVFGIAAELASAQAGGPGSLRMYLLDALYNLTPDLVKQHARIVIEK